MNSAITIDISPKIQYEPLYTIHAARKDLFGGRGRGGSHEGTLYALQRLTSPVYYRIAFLRKIYKDVRHSLWADFKDRITEASLPDAHFNMADHEMRCTYLPTGNMINSFGVKAEGGRTAKLKSLAGYNLIIIEEADELTEEEFNMIDDSLRTVKGPPPEIVLIFNPPGRLHWIWKKYNLIEAEVKGYWRAVPKEGENILSIFGTYKDNIKNITPEKREKWEAYKTSNPEYYYTIICGLISEGQRGRIFSGWNPITQERFIGVQARGVYGLDFGWSESPMALAEYKLVKNKVYAREHVYKTGMTLKELAIEMCKLGITGNDDVVADSEDAISINKLRTGWSTAELTEFEIENYPQLLKGFYVHPALKPPGSVNYGIDIIKEREVYVCEDSLNFWNEYREYKWALDKDKNPTNTPEDKNNHLMDPTRYVVTGKGRIFN